jgi:hypothetical protein
MMRTTLNVAVVVASLIAGFLVGARCRGGGNDHANSCSDAGVQILSAGWLLNETASMRALNRLVPNDQANPLRHGDLLDWSELVRPIPSAKLGNQIMHTGLVSYEVRGDRLFKEGPIQEKMIIREMNSYNSSLDRIHFQSAFRR